MQRTKQETLRALTRIDAKSCLEDVLRDFRSAHPDASPKRGRIDSRDDLPAIACAAIVKSIGTLFALADIYLDSKPARSKGPLVQEIQGSPENEAIEKFLAGLLEQAKSANTAISRRGHSSTIQVAHHLKGNKLFEDMSVVLVLGADKVLTGGSLPEAVAWIRAEWGKLNPKN